MTDSTSHSVAHSVDPREPDPDLVKWLKENCVPMVGMAFGALVFCLVVHYGSITVDWTATKDFTEGLANLTQSVALIAGGVWAYFKFARGRTFQDRLIPTVTGKFVSIGGSIFLIVTAQIKNVGLSKITFDPIVSTLTILEYISTEADEILTVKNKPLTSFRMFGNSERYIEPNEIITRQCLIALARVSNIGYQLDFEVLSDYGFTWRATAIVAKSGFEDNDLG